MKISYLTVMLPYAHAFIPHAGHQINAVRNVATSTFIHKRSSFSTLSSVSKFQQSLAENPKNTVLLDVRERDEWDEAHLSLANLSPLSTLSSGTYPVDNKTGETILKDANVFIHCRLGGRAKKAADILKTMGYKNVVPLGESFEQLVATGICDVE